MTGVEAAFGVTYPLAFTSFCRAHETVAPENGASGRFITDMSTLTATNARIGCEEWGDYEQAIVGARREKSGKCLWGGMLPFFLSGNAVDIVGFDATSGGGDAVLIWSVHCVVYSYPDFAAWLAQGQEIVPPAMPRR